MPALDELGWLQFERLCELVLEADAGIDPTRWEGSADRRAGSCARTSALDGRDARSAGAGPLPVAARGRGRVAPPAESGSVVTFVNRPVGRDRRRRLRRGRAARRDPPPARAAPASCRRCSRSTPRRPTRTRWRARRSTSRPRASWRACSCRRAPGTARVAVLERAPLRRAHRPAGDGQDGDRAHARARAADRGLGGARVHPARAGRGALRPRRARSCSSPTTRSARPSTARTPPSAGRATSTAILRATDERHWLVWTSRPGAAAGRPAPAPPRARRRALPAARPRCRSTRRRSTSRRRR